jgi:tetratricopeptide (TPR) repeat protein
MAIVASDRNNPADRWQAWLPYLHCGVILLLGIVCYGNSLDAALQFDDQAAVRASATSVPGWQGFMANARWFADLTFALNRQLHGERVFGFHLFNLAIHLAAALACYATLRQAIAALRRTFRLDGADVNYLFVHGFIPFATAALFVCHPLQTQAVTYIIQRYTSLAALLYLASLLSYLLARRALGDDTKKRRVWLWGGASFALALLALKSKEIAFTLPLMIVLCEAALFRGELLKKRLFWALAAALLLVLPLQLLLAQGAAGPENLLERMQAATAETVTISRGDYLLTEFRVVATYLRLLLAPLGQNLDYDYPLFHSLFEPQVAAALLLHLALAGLAAALFVRSRRRLAGGAAASGIQLRLAALGICWFYLALSVESSVVPIRDVIFEHRVYLPSVGFFLVVTTGMAGVATRWRRCRLAAWGAVALICLALSAGTIARNRVWGSEQALWLDVLKKSPGKARVNYAVGVLYFKKFKPEQALPYLVKALELDAASEKHWVALNDAVAIIRRYKGRSTDGMKYHLAADRVNPAYLQPWWAVSYNNLGLAYEHAGNLPRALEFFRKAADVDPALDLAWCNLALAAARGNDTPAVAAALARLRALNPLLEQDVATVIRERLQ